MNNLRRYRIATRYHFPGLCRSVPIFLKFLCSVIENIISPLDPHLSGWETRRKLTLMRISNQRSVNKEPKCTTFRQFICIYYSFSFPKETGRPMRVCGKKVGKRQSETKPESHAELFIFLQRPNFCVVAKGSKVGVFWGGMANQLSKWKIEIGEKEASRLAEKQKLHSFVTIYLIWSIEISSAGFPFLVLNAKAFFIQFSAHVILTNY